MQLAVQAALADAEQPRGLAAMATRPPQRRLDVRALHLVEGLEGDVRGVRSGDAVGDGQARLRPRRARRGGEVLGPDLLAFTTDPRALDDVQELRTFPGQSRPWSTASVPAARRFRKPKRSLNTAMKCWARRATSDRRSRSGGTVTVIVRSR